MQELNGLFATPLLKARLPDADVANAALRDTILARMATGPAAQISNIGGWHSTTDMIDWGGPAMQRLVETVIDLCGRNTTDVAAQGRSRFLWVPQAWANVSTAGAANQTHAHAGAIWSAVYYVDDGYGGSSDPALGGELMLLDPRFPMTMMAAPDLRYRAPDGKRYECEVLLRPETGLIVAFPSWLSHAVRPYHGAHKRISIAINLVAVPVPPAR